MKMKNNWQIKKLGEITENLDSKRVPIDAGERNKRVGNIPYYGANGQIGWIDDYLFDEQLLLIAEDGGNWGPFVNSSYIIAGKSWVNNHAHVLRCGDTFTLRYLNYYLNFKDLRKYISGTTRGKLNQKALNSIDILLPPEETKTKIVERLDAIRKLQELNQIEIEKAEELFLSVVSKWFKSRSDWSVKKLEEITVSMQSGYASRPISKEVGIAQIRPHNITREGQFSLEGIKYVPFVKKDNYLVKKGDVIFNNTNSAELVGKTAYIGENIKVVFSNHMTRIRVDEAKINPYFLATYLHTLYQSRYFQGLCTAWVNQAAINSTLLKGLKIPLPPIEEQKKTVDSLSTLRDYKNTLRVEEEKLTELFESTLNKAMKGELSN